jgi:hypothetical protein
MPRRLDSRCGICHTTEFVYYPTHGRFETLLKCEYPPWVGSGRPGNNRVGPLSANCGHRPFLEAYAAGARSIMTSARFLPRAGAGSCLSGA